jgi:hypothetical protein
MHQDNVRQRASAHHRVARAHVEAPEERALGAGRRRCAHGECGPRAAANRGVSRGGGWRGDGGESGVAAAHASAVAPAARQARRRALGQVDGRLDGRADLVHNADVDVAQSRLDGLNGQVEECLAGSRGARVHVVEATAIQFDYCQW